MCLILNYLFVVVELKNQDEMLVLLGQYTLRVILFREFKIKSRAVNASSYTPPGWHFVSPNTFSFGKVAMPQLSHV